MEEALSGIVILRHDRCHDGIECRDQIPHLQSNLQSSLAAVDIDEVVRERLLFDYRRNLARLTERADAAGLVAGDPFRRPQASRATRATRGTFWSARERKERIISLSAGCITSERYPLSGGAQGVSTLLVAGADLASKK